MRTQLPAAQGFLLRHGIGYEGQDIVDAEVRALAGHAELRGPADGVHRVLLATKAGDQRVERLSQSLQDAIKGWRFRASGQSSGPCAAST